MYVYYIPFLLLGTTSLNEYIIVVLSIFLWIGIWIVFILILLCYYIQHFYNIFVQVPLWK